MMAEKKQQTELKGQDLLRSIEEAHITSAVPDFVPGDSLEVGVRIKEGDVSRVQNFIGICIARRGAGTSENFTVRRIVQGEGVERIFPLHCPSIHHVKVLRRGRVRRAKLHYLRQRTGRRARVRGKIETAKKREE